MGNTQNSVPHHRRPLGRLDKTDIKICCQLLSNHISLQLNKKADEFKFKELEIAKLLRNPYFDRMDLGLSCHSIIKTLKYIKACKIVMKDCKIIEDKAGIIEAIVAKNSFSELDSLMPYIESIIWSTSYLNLQQIKQFTAMIYSYFGPTVFNEVKAFNRVDVELKGCSEEPVASEISNYLDGVISRHKIPNVNAKDLLSEVKTSYNPMTDFNGNDTCPPSNPYPQNPTLPIGSNEAQIKEISNMLEGYDLARKNCAQVTSQSFLEVVKKLRSIGV